MTKPNPLDGEKMLKLRFGKKLRNLCFPYKVMNKTLDDYFPKFNISIIEIIIKIINILSFTQYLLISIFLSFQSAKMTMIVKNEDVCWLYKCNDTCKFSEINYSQKQ